MAKSVNKVILLGNVGRDPEIRSTGGGTMVANFSVATSERSRDAQGNWQDRSEWHNVVAYSKLAEIIRDYVKKGNKLYVEGRLTTRSWDDKDTGKKVYRTEIIANDISLLSGRDEAGSGGGYSSNRSGGYSSGGGGNTASFDQRPSSGMDDYADQGITDDDIPF